MSKRILAIACLTATMSVPVAAFDYGSIKKLTLDLVLAVAIQNSDSYKALAANVITARATREGADSGYDWVLLADYSLARNEPDVSNPFSPSKIGQDSWRLGARKSFLTGTALEFSYGRSANEIGFQNPSVVIPDYYEDKFNVSLSQNLWADAFGRAARAGRRSLLRLSDSQEIAAKAALEKWSMDFIALYYDAWLSQSRYFAAEENLRRRKTLLDVTRLKSRRGTAEAPDVLQVQASWLMAQNALSKAEADLHERWRSLVITLKLPPEVARLDPAKIPMELDEVAQDSSRICAADFKAEDTNSVREAKLKFEAAEEGAVQASSQLNPKLQLVANYATNGIDGRAGQAFEETSGADHPSWSVGVNLQVPLGFAQEKSRYMKSQAELVQARMGYSSAVDVKIIELRTVCDKMKRAAGQVENSRQALASQTRRLDLEERRFRLGRTTTFQVIQAGDDKTNSELNKNGDEIALRTLAWNVLKAASQIDGRLRDWLKKYE